MQTPRQPRSVALAIAGLLLLTQANASGASDHQYQVKVPLSIKVGPKLDGDTGTAPKVPQLSFDQDGLDFGVLAPSATASHKLVLSNWGTGPASLGTPRVEGSGFSLESTSCQASLGAGAKCDISVAFKPASLGSFTGSLALDGGSVGVLTVSLDGASSGSIARWAQTTLDFGDQPATGGTVTKTLRIYNDGDVAGDFGVGAQLAPGMTSTSCQSVAAHGQCLMVFTFTPVAGLSYSTGPLFPLHASASVNSLSIVGKGIAATYSLALSSTNAAFGSIATGDTSEPYVVTLTNQGNVSLPLSEPLVTAPAGFTATHSCNNLIVAGGSCELTLGFSPTEVQPYSGNVTVNAGLAGNKTIAVSGTGRAPVYSVMTTPSVVTFPDTPVNSSSAPITVTLTNSGNASLTLPEPLTSQSQGFTVTNTCGTRLAPGYACKINITFSPTLFQTYSGGVMVSAGAAGNKLLTVAGKGS